MRNILKLLISKYRAPSCAYISIAHKYILHNYKQFLDKMLSFHFQKRTKRTWTSWRESAKMTIFTEFQLIQGNGHSCWLTQNGFDFCSSLLFQTLLVTPVFKRVTSRRLIFAEMNFRVDLFTPMQFLPYFTWIYFGGCWKFNNFAWTYFRGCQILYVIFTSGTLIVEKKHIFAKLLKIYNWISIIRPYR